MTVWPDDAAVSPAPAQGILNLILAAVFIAKSVVMDFTSVFTERPIFFLIISISSVFYYIWLHLQFVREHADALVTRQRVQQMLSQIKPHFLHNALTLIIALCDTAPRRQRGLDEVFQVSAREWNPSTGPAHFL